MKLTLVYILTILTLTLPVKTYAQKNNIEIANRLYENREFQSALTQYQKAFKKNRRLHKAHKYEYFYLLFQIAESKRHLKDSTCKNYYQKIIDKHFDIEWAGFLKLHQRTKKIRSNDRKLKKDSAITWSYYGSPYRPSPFPWYNYESLDKRVLLFVAESEKNVLQFERAESRYQQALSSVDTLPDFFKFGYAFCSLKQNRYGQALVLLSEIKNRKTFEPRYSEYDSICKTELSKSIVNNLQIDDTLKLTMKYVGCHGGVLNKFAIIKNSNNYKVISYKDQHAFEQLSWKIDDIDQIHTIADSTFSLIADFEDELKRHNQYNASESCTIGGYFSFEAKNEYFQVHITDCALGMGVGLKNTLSKK